MDNATVIKSASYSRLLVFEQCKYRAKLQFHDKLPDVQGDAAARGERIHLLAEKYVMGKIKTLPPELRKFKEDFEALRASYKAGNVSVEGEWGFTSDWVPCDYKTATLRVKADAVAFKSKTHAVVIDHKTGRKYGNELKHGEQILLYAIATFIRDALLEEITVELWFLDLDEMTQQHYTRNEALRYVQSFDQRIKKMLECKTFPANPNAFTCKWCPYGPAKGGQCEHGVVSGAQTIKLYREKFG